MRKYLVVLSSLFLSINLFALRKEEPKIPTLYAKGNTTLIELAAISDKALGDRGIVRDGPNHYHLAGPVAIFVDGSLDLSSQTLIMNGNEIRIDVRGELTYQSPKLRSFENLTAEPCDMTPPAKAAPGFDGQQGNSGLNGAHAGRILIHASRMTGTDPNGIFEILNDGQDGSDGGAGGDGGDPVDPKFLAGKNYIPPDHVRPLSGVRIEYGKETPAKKGKPGTHQTLPGPAGNGGNGGNGGLIEISADLYTSVSISVSYAGGSGGQGGWRNGAKGKAAGAGGLGGLDSKGRRKATGEHGRMLVAGSDHPKWKEFKQIIEGEKTFPGIDGDDGEFKFVAMNRQQAEAIELHKIPPGVELVDRTH